MVRAWETWDRHAWTCTDVCALLRAVITTFAGNPENNLKELGTQCVGVYPTNPEPVSFGTLITRYTDVREMSLARVAPVGLSPGVGVDLRRLKSVDEARTAVHAQFKALAKSQLTVMHKGVHDETWDHVVVAKRAALDALDRADAAPPSAFHPLSGVGPAQVPDDVKEKRLYRMKDRADAHALARSQRYTGWTEAVLVESRNTRVPTQVAGRTRGNKLVFFEGAAEELVGRTVDVRILNASTFSLIGERVS